MFRPLAVRPESRLSFTVASPAAERNVGSQSVWCMISLETAPGWTQPGQRTAAGTRQPPTQLAFFSPRKGVAAASGQLLSCGPSSVL